MLMSRYELMEMLQDGIFTKHGSKYDLEGYYILIMEEYEMD